MNEDSPTTPSEHEPRPGGGSEPAASGHGALGGDETTQENLQADNEVEEDQLRTLDPEQPPS